MVKVELSKLLCFILFGDLFILMNYNCYLCLLNFCLLICSRTSSFSGPGIFYTSQGGNVLVKNY